MCCTLWRNCCCSSQNAHNEWIYRSKKSHSNESVSIDTRLLVGATLRFLGKMSLQHISPLATLMVSTNKKIFRCTNSPRTNKYASAQWLTFPFGFCLCKIDFNEFFAPFAAQICLCTLFDLVLITHKLHKWIVVSLSAPILYVEFFPFYRMFRNQNLKKNNTDSKDHVSGSSLRGWKI